MNSDIVVNTRILGSHLTGVQRYLDALLSHFPVTIARQCPTKPRHGSQGHLWEQLILPGRVGKSLLWSPSNTGPLLLKNQVLTVHDVVPLDHPEWLNRRFAAWYRLLLPRLIPRVKRVIAVSEFSKSRILANIQVDPEKIVVIHNGVDERFFPQPENVTAKMAETLALPSRRYLLSVGSLEPRKNLQRLLQAWELIQNDTPDDLWLVLSGAPGRQLVFQKVSLDRLPPKVHITGHISDDLLPALYGGALGFVYPSLYEGFGLPPLEAMACGIPTMTGNLTVFPEVVGDAALMVDPYDVAAIAQGLRELIADAPMRERLRVKGLARVREMTWKKSAAQTWRILTAEAAKL